MDPGHAVPVDTARLDDAAEEQSGTDRASAPIRVVVDIDLVPVRLLVVVDNAAAAAAAAAAARGLEAHREVAGSGRGGVLHATSELYSRLR
jgi:hypothetical protein